MLSRERHDPDLQRWVKLRAFEQQVVAFDPTNATLTLADVSRQVPAPSRQRIGVEASSCWEHQAGLGL